MFKEYDIFRLAKPIAGESIPVGTQGVVLMVFEEGQAYEVEFVDGSGRNLGWHPTHTLTEDYLNADPDVRRQ